MKLTLKLVVAFLFFATLTTSKAQNRTFVPVKDSVGDSIPFYFPVDTSVIENRFNEWTWASRVLFKMNESLLPLDSSHTEIYRFIWLRSFHNPIAIRIQNDEKKYLLFWKELNGFNGRTPGEIKTNGQKSITGKEWETFKDALKEIDFWELERENDRTGDDGSEWILEGKTPDHVIYRWTPSRKSSYYKACNYLIKLTDLKIKAGHKY